MLDVLTCIVIAVVEQFRSEFFQFHRIGFGVGAGDLNEQRQFPRNTQITVVPHHALRRRRLS